MPLRLADAIWQAQAERTPVRRHDRHLSADPESLTHPSGYHARQVFQT